jgi:hypothetical protein
VIFLTVCNNNNHIVNIPSETTVTQCADSAQQALLSASGPTNSAGKVDLLTTFSLTTAVAIFLKNSYLKDHPESLILYIFNAECYVWIVST